MAAYPPPPGYVAPPFQAPPGPPKKPFPWLLVIVLSLVGMCVCCGGIGVAGYLSYRNSRQTAEKYADQVLHGPAFASWNADAFIRELGPDFFGARDQGSIVQSVRKSFAAAKKKLGGAVSYGPVTGSAPNVYYGVGDNGNAQASEWTNCTVKYERGACRVRLQLARRDNEWKVARFELYPVKS